MLIARRQSARGFTLIELLVVIGIITILMGILIPTIRAARGQAQATGCASNLRQLYNAQMFYADEHEGRLASAQGVGADDRWTVKLAKYFSKSPNAEEQLMKLYCGAVEPDRLTVGVITYGVNSCLLMPNWQQRRAAKYNTSEIILMGDRPVGSNDQLITEDLYFLEAQFDGPAWMISVNHKSAASYRHQRNTKANMLMADGSVRPMAASELLRDGGHWYWGSIDELQELEYWGVCCE